MLGPVWRMVGASAVSWLALAAVVERATALAMLGGMLGPLAMAAGSWLLTARTHQRNPGRVTAVMMAAFAAKAVFVGAYVFVLVRRLGVAPLPFAASFGGYFIGLYAIEAWYLRRLFAGGRS